MLITMRADQPCWDGSEKADNERYKNDSERYKTDSERYKNDSERYKVDSERDKADSDSNSSGIGTADVTETVSNSSELDQQEEIRDHTFPPSPLTPGYQGPHISNGYDGHLILNGYDGQHSPSTYQVSPSSNGYNNGPHTNNGYTAGPHTPSGYTNGYRQHCIRSSSTGSEQSYDGSSSSNDLSPHSTPVKNKLRLSQSYDPNVSKILQFHRSLAAYYNHGPTLHMNGDYKGSSESLDHRRSPRTSDIGTAQLKSILRQNGKNSEPSTPTYENFPILPSKGKSIKFNLGTITESKDRTYKESLSQSVSQTDRAHRQLLQTVSYADTRGKTRQRSSSLEDIVDRDDDSDGNNDDYGFLTYYGSGFVSVSSAMHRAKSPASLAAGRIFNKRWRRSKPSSSSSSPGQGKTRSPWTPQGGCVWSNSNGSKVQVPGCSILQLSQVERLVLQKLALAKLQTMQLGCSISLPKDEAKRAKKAFSLKRKTNSESQGSGWVFGLPLSKTIANDEELRRRRPTQLHERRDSLDIPHRNYRKSSSSSAEAQSSESLSESETRSAASNLLDALSLSASSKLDSTWRQQREALTPRSPQVPYIVKSCCQHLETYGLQVLGIFRIGCSKKRIRQLRDEFDSGKDVKLNEEHNPHDVAGLLKEYFRDLPDPLLCRDLYSAFVATRKIKDEGRRLAALRCLIALLQAPNQDTLWMLVRFLSQIVKHSTDTVDAHGHHVAGNRMDSHNLATLFGPNILHKAKGREFEVESMERAEERQDVISVVKELIDHHESLFQLPAEMHDEVLRVLHETNTEAADFILKRMPSTLGIDMDPETSCSSFYDDSDGSSIPRSPSYTSETEGPRNLNEALAMKDRSDKAQPLVETLKVPQFRIITPDQVWYKPDRSPSPTSPRISPSPKAMRQTQLGASPMLSRQSQLGASPSLGQSQPLIIPRPVKFQRSPMLVAKSPRSPSMPPGTLTVPGGGERRGSDSSSSSYYPYSSRSPSHSPLSHEPPPSPLCLRTAPRWYPETPPTTPSYKDKEFKPLTSSTQRPLGVSPVAHDTPPSGPLQGWQKERWKHWEKLAKQRSADPHEQETLV